MVIDLSPADLAFKASQEPLIGSEKGPVRMIHVKFEVYTLTPYTR